MCHNRTAVRLLILMTVFWGTIASTNASENPFEGFWRSKNGTIVKIQGDQGVVIRSDEPHWHGMVDQVSIKNIHQQADHWLVEEWVLTGADQGAWLTVEWQLADDTITRSYTYDDLKMQSVFERISADEAYNSGQPLQAEPPGKPWLPLHSVQIGAELSHRTYEEPNVMEEKGLMYGIRAVYAYHNQLMFKTEARIGYGQVDYTSNGTGAIDGIDDFLLEVRMLWGYDIPLDTASILTPYIGLGYRFLKDDSEGKQTTTGHFGYLREANYYYSPIGLNALADLRNRWSLEVTAEYDLFWRGVQRSYLSGVDASLNDLRNVQSKGYGCRFALDLHKQFTNTHIVFGPFIHYWSIDDSEVDFLYDSGLVVPFIEPENTTTEYGFNVSFLF